MLLNSEKPFEKEMDTIVRKEMLRKIYLISLGAWFHLLSKFLKEKCHTLIVSNFKRE
jgi:hypothetical protein